MFGPSSIANLVRSRWIQHVQIFENRGALMGASNPHPHCQIWANETIPNQPARELAAQTEYHEKHQKCLLCSYLMIEQNDRERIVSENESFVALVPYWAVWPFETMILSRRHAGSFLDFTDAERNDLAAIMSSLTIRYDNLFSTAFPYTMGFHQQPTDGKPHPEWHFHAHYFPPLLRSATVQKVHGRIRNARQPSARYHGGERCSAFARRQRSSFSGTSVSGLQVS